MAKKAAPKAGSKMTQTQIINALAETMDLNKKVVKELFEETAALAVRETKKSGVFVLPGFGRLVKIDRKARMGRNPATGEAIKIPAKKLVKFRIAKATADQIVPPRKK